jgi:glycerol-3-phosphate dehydrogenase
VSRKHRIIETGAGILTVVGGKYTTYRAVAREVVDRLAPGKRSETHRRPLHGGEAGNWEKYQTGPGRSWIERFGAEPVRRLFQRYGSRLSEVLRLAEEDPELREPLDPSCPEIRAEAVHGVLREEVRYPGDFICRRTDLRFQNGNGRAAYDEVEAIIHKHAGPLNAVPLDLAAARERFHEELAWEDRLRQGPAVPAK